MSVPAAIALAARDIKLHHSVFALPFAVLAACIAAQTGVASAGVASAGANAGVAGSGIIVSDFVLPLALVCVAMIAARTTAMLANRIADAKIDAGNPRTQGRAIPSGRLSFKQAWIFASVSAIIYFLACAGFGFFQSNWWPLALSTPVLAWLIAYPFIKRISWMCHVWLGISLAMSAPAAALAVHPESATQPVMWWLAGMILLWVAGFDVIYALQDVAIDRRDALHSMPADLGVKRAMLVSRIMHVGAVACLLCARISYPALGRPFEIAIALTACVLLLEHITVRRWGTTKMALTFFTLNGIVSVILGVSGVLGICGALS